MTRVSAEISSNPHSRGFICRVEVRDYGTGNRRELATRAVAKSTAREAWASCSRFVQGFTSKQVSGLGRSRRRR